VLCAAAHAFAACTASACSVQPHKHVSRSFSCSANLGDTLLCACREFGPLFEWSMGPMRAVDITDYDTIRTLMAQDGKVGLPFWMLLFGYSLYTLVNIRGHRFLLRDS
jgi:hypothetical protein